MADTQIKKEVRYVNKDFASLRTNLVNYAKVYFPNGKMRYEGQYANNKEIGVWKFYNEDGKLKEEKDFK